jgi:hypothetical protein
VNSHLNIEQVAQEIFQTLRSFDYESVLYDDNGNIVYEPTEARRFFIKTRNMLVAIVDKGEDSTLKLYLGSDVNVMDIKGLRTSLRAIATKYNILYNVREFGKEISPQDFATNSSVHENFRSNMYLLEGMYGTSRSSYLKLENARMIVRHKKRINEESVGSRGRNIDSIYIENNAGERHLFPTTNLAPARAMAHHVDTGGSWADSVGQQIGRMATDYANLGITQNYIFAGDEQIAEGALEARLRLRESIADYRSIFEKMCRNGRRMEAKEEIESRRALTEDAMELDSLTESLSQNICIEGKELPKEVLESVARVFETEDRRFKLKRENDDNYIAVLSRKVDKDAWEAFKTGTLALDKSKLPTTVPKFADLGSKLVFWAREIGAACEEESMGNLFSYIAEEMNRVSNKKNRLSDVRYEKDVQNYKMNTKLLADMKAVVSIAMKRAGVGTLSEAAPALETVKIFNQVNVNKSAWDAFKTGKIETFTPVSFDHHPQFVSDDAILGWCMGHIAEKTKDETLGNLFGLVSDSFAAHDHHGVPLESLKRVVHCAVKALRLKLPTVVAHTPAIREHFEWINEFKIGKILAEDERSRMDNNEEMAGQALDELYSNFDMDAFIKSTDIDPMYDDGDMVLNGSELKSDLTSYLTHEAEVNAVDPSLNVDDLADEIMEKIVKPYLSEKGYSIEGGIDEAHDELNDLGNDEVELDDFHFPTNQGDDLIDDVTPSTVRDLDTGKEEELPSDDYLNRLTSLAGMAGSGNFTR